MNGVPHDTRLEGPEVPRGYVPCTNCGAYAASHPSGDGQVNGPKCHTQECPVRMCSECQELIGPCYHCGEFFCVDHSRPNHSGKGRICAGCDGCA
jgi:hypothetical protein